MHTTTTYRAEVKQLQPLKSDQSPYEYNVTGEGIAFDGFTVMFDHALCGGQRFMIFCPGGQVFAVYLDPEE